MDADVFFLCFFNEKGGGGRYPPATFSYSFPSPHSASALRVSFRVDWFCHQEEERNAEMFLFNLPLMPPFPRGNHTGVVKSTALLCRRLVSHKKKRILLEGELGDKYVCLIKPSVCMSIFSLLTLSPDAAFHLFQSPTRFSYSCLHCACDNDEHPSPRAVFAFLVHPKIGGDLAARDEEEEDPLRSTLPPPSLSRLPGERRNTDRRHLVHPCA